MHANDLAEHLSRDLLRLTRLRCLGGPRGALGRRPPSLTVRAATRERRLYGRASFRRNAITIILYRSTTRADAAATLLHELVHLAGHVRHDARFKAALVTAAREGFNVDVSAYERGSYKNLDRALENELAWRATKAWAASLWARVVGAYRRAWRTLEHAPIGARESRRC